MEVSKVFSQVRVPHCADFFKMSIGVFALFPSPKSAEVTRQSSARVPASPSSSELSAHQMALARESDEPGGALDDATADLQRWRRGLRRRDGGVEAAVAVLSRLASGKRGVHAAWSSTLALPWCRDQRWVGGGRRRLSA